MSTVNVVRDELGGGQSDVAWMLAASGGGTLVVALLLPRLLDRIAERTVMTAGAGVLVAGVIAAVVMSATGTVSWALMASIWTAIGAGTAMVVTPTGRVIRSATTPAGLPAAFAAQFSLSHLAWLVTYPLAGWVGTAVGVTTAWSILGVLAAAGAVGALALWPRRAMARGTGAVPVPAHEGRGGARRALDVALPVGVKSGSRGAAQSGHRRSTRQASLSPTYSTPGRTRR